jgi:Flp pilus assembly protein TadD
VGSLAKAGRNAQATAHLERAVVLAPDSLEYRFNLAYVLGLAGRFADAVPQLQKAVDLSGGQDWRCFDLLGAAYSQVGRLDDAIQAELRAVDLAVANRNDEVIPALRAKLARYRQSK